MQPSLEIFAKVYGYLEGESTLEELEDWLVPNLGFFLEEPGSPEAELAWTVELGRDEMSIGHRSEDEFRQMLREFIERQPLLVFQKYPEGEPRQITGGSYVLTTPAIRFGPLTMVQLKPDYRPA